MKWLPLLLLLAACHAPTEAKPRVLGASADPGNTGLNWGVAGVNQLNNFACDAGLTVVFGDGGYPGCGVASGGGSGLPSAPGTGGFYLLSADGGGGGSWVIATQDEIGAAFAPSLSLTSGGSGPFEVGATWTPTFTSSPAYNASGVTLATETDNQGHSGVAIASNPFGPPTVSSYTLSPTSGAPGSVSVYATFTQNGVGPRNTSSIGVSWGQKVWYGVGTAGATGLNGSTGALSGATGTLTSGGVSTSGVVAFSVSPSNQKVYYASDTYYGTRTFKDSGGFTFAMNSPATISVTNAQSITRSYYLYESTNLLSSVSNPITPQ